MPETSPSIDETLTAYLAGTLPREEARTRLRDALRRGQELTSKLRGVPPDRQDEVLALFQQVARDVLGGTQAPPSRWPPLGHMLLAGLLGLTVLSAAAALLFPAQWGAGAVTGPHPWVLRTLTAVTAVAAAGAAWAVWTRDARVLLVYGGWAALAIASTIYVAFVAIPGAARAMGFSGTEAFHLGTALWVVIEKVLLCGIGFGYLFVQRPKSR